MLKVMPSCTRSVRVLQSSHLHLIFFNFFFLQLLTTATFLASSLNETTLASAYAANATSLKAAFNSAFWVPSLGMYRDNTSTALAPQDANSFALLFNVTDSDEKRSTVSAGLTKNWNEVGAVAPELPDTISPFIGGFEVG
jgi:hypothetical protein